MDKVILVFGGTGLIGEHIARRLKEDGYRVRVMARDSNKARKMFDESFEIAIGDVKDTNSLEESLNGCLGIHMNVTEDVEQLGAENVASVAPKKELSESPILQERMQLRRIHGFPPSKGNCLQKRLYERVGFLILFFAPLFLWKLYKCSLGEIGLLFLERSPFCTIWWRWRITQEWFRHLTGSRKQQTRSYSYMVRKP